MLYIVFSVFICLRIIYIYIYIYIYMKSSFPKRDKRQIEKKLVRHAILLCTEPIHCSINVSCQIAIFPCLKCTARCSFFQTAISAEPFFSLNAIYPLDQSEFVRCNRSMLWSACLCSVFKMSALNSNNTFWDLHLGVENADWTKKITKNKRWCLTDWS